MAPPRFGEGKGRGMKSRNIVIGQRISARKAGRARQLRRNQTAEEELLWQRLRGNRLCGLHFRRQQVIDGFIVDFYCHGAGLVVEVDGAVHLGQRANDQERDRVLQGRGLTVLRVPNELVRNDIEAVLQRITRTIGSPLPVSGRVRGRGQKMATNQQVHHSIDVGSPLPVSGRVRGRG